MSFKVDCSGVRLKPNDMAKCCKLDANTGLSEPQQIHCNLNTFSDGHDMLDV